MNTKITAPQLTISCDGIITGKFWIFQDVRMLHANHGKRDSIFKKISETRRLVDSIGFVKIEVNGVCPQ